MYWKAEVFTDIVEANYDGTGATLLQPIQSFGFIPLALDENGMPSYSRILVEFYNFT